MALTRSQVARTLSAEIGLSRKNSAEVIYAFTRAITKALVAGEEVRIRNFGRFKVISFAGRRRKGLSSDVLIPGKARKIVRFKSSKRLMACLQEVAGVYEDLSGFNALLQLLQKSLEITARVKKVLDAHCRWVESEGGESKRADLSRFNLEGADLFGSNLRSANLSGAKLANADLSDCDLENADLENVDLKRASLAWANLRHAHMKGGCFRDADLRWADLRWANLSEADLSGANLSGADLNDAVLKGAKLRGARVKNTILEKKNPFSLSALKIRLKKLRP
jgi:uncharacterized protein YjbI with pentapeptide repeats